MDVSVQIFSYKEPELRGTLDAYAEQQVPPFVDDVTYTAAVTPRDELRTSMVEEVVSHDTFGLLETPPGKLSSRNVAHDRAVGSGADVIVVGDADAPPLGDDYLTRLLDPFHDGDAAAANSRPVSPWLTPLGAAANVLGVVEDRVKPHLNGQGHALSAPAWLSAGPFQVENLDQTDSTRIRAEEEFDFRGRVERAGPVHDLWNATVYNDLRRTECLLRKSVRTTRNPIGDYCKRTTSSSVTFQPRTRHSRVSDDGRRG